MANLIKGDGLEPQDILLTCVECQTEFLFTVSEQDFYDERGLQQPKRCTPCRKFKKVRFTGR